MNAVSSPMTGLDVRRLDSAQPDFDRQLQALLERGGQDDPEIHRAVVEIIRRVRAEGDRALIELTRRFDALDVEHADDLRLSREHLDRALTRVDPELRRALEYAAGRIRDFHQRQLQEPWTYTDANGTRLGQKITALDRVGIYVPGGKAAYPSSVLMNAIPAAIAGVGQIVMAVPAPGGELSDAVLAAAALAGVDGVYRIGGAQAIAALAYGTETVPSVDKIVGPGNAYVATAKKLVFGRVGIDMIAGPSEVVVFCDNSVDPEWAAMDLFAQAEHDELAQAILLSPDAGVIERVHRAMTELLPSMPRAPIIRTALAAHGALIHVRDVAEGVRLADRIAPEHLELMLKDPAPALDAVRHAGAIFVGRYSAEAMGDYCAGPNHVLPTSGTARFSSPLGVYDFQKRTSVIECSPRAVNDLAAAASVLARAESLIAHARSAEYRFKS